MTRESFDIERFDVEETPLHHAESAEDVGRILATTGLGADDQGWSGETPLHAAAERGRADVAAELLRRGAQVDARRPDSGCTPLHSAASDEVARVLLAAGADPVATDQIGRTPLDQAARFGRADVARVLLAAGASPSATARDGQAPLDRAARFGHADVVAALLDAGAVVDHAARDGATSLHGAAEGGHAEVASRLLAAGAAVDPHDATGRTPLHRAAACSRADVVALLLAAGADPGLRAGAAGTPRHMAMARGHDAAAALLEAAQGPAAHAERIEVPTPAAGSSGLLRIQMHPTRPEAVTTAGDATLHRWVLADLPRVEVGRQPPLAWFGDVAVDPSGAVVAVATSAPNIELRSWDDLRVVDRITWPPGAAGDVLPHGRYVHALALSPDGRWLAVSDLCEEIHLVDRTSGRVVASAEAGEWTGCLRFDPSSRLLASALSFQGGAEVRVDRIEDGRLIPVAELDRSDHRTPAGQFVNVLPHLAFSPDGRHLALYETSRHGTGHDPSRPRGWRGNVVLFDAATWAKRWCTSVDAGTTGDERSPAEAGHGMGFLTEVAFVDDATLACGATRGTVLFYRVADGMLLRRARVHAEAPVVSLAVEPATGALWAALGPGGGPPVRVPDR